MFNLDLISRGIEDADIIFGEYLNDINYRDNQGDNLLIKYFKSKR